MSTTNTLFRKISITAAAAAVIGAGALYFGAGVSDASADSPSPKAVTIGLASSFTTLDPFTATDSVSRQTSKSFYEGLFARDDNLKVVPQLAESYAVSDDGLVYTIKLRAGVKFQDGTDFNAEAAKMNVERMLDPANKLTRRSQYEVIDKVEAVDALTLRMTLKRPFSPIINRLAADTLQMVCPSAIKKGNAYIAFNPCGTGPFLLKEYNPSEKLVVVKNPNYWRAGYPKLDQITWLPVVENATRAAMAETGEADFIYPAPVEMMNKLRANKDLDVIDEPAMIMRYLELNNSVKPLNDPRVRQAINFAINKEALCKVAFSGYARPASGVIPAQVPGAKKIGPWPYDPKKAKALLAEAGYPNGFEMPLWSGYNNSTSSKVVQFVQQQLAQVGIRTSVTMLEAGQRVAQVEALPKESSKYRLYYIGWNTTPEIDWALRPLFDSRSQAPVLANEAYYENKRVDELLDRGLALSDEAERSKVYGEVQELIWNDAPWVWLVFEDNTSAKNKKLKNFKVLPDASFSFYEADLEQ